MTTAMLTTAKYHVTEEELAVEERQILAARQDRSQFAPLYNRYHEQIFRYIYQRLDSKDTAADITSQVFLKAMLNLPGYELRGLPFSSWLYRIAKNELNLWFRSKKAERTVNAYTVNLKDMMEEMEEADSDGRYATGILTGALNKLSGEEVELIEMRYFEKRPFREIGEILGITENYSKVRVYRILDKLRKIITTKEG